MARFHTEALARDTYWMILCIIAIWWGVLLVWRGQGK